jgi:flagellar FliJ protein
MNSALENLIEIACREKREAAARIGHAQQRCQEEDARLAALESFVSDYASRTRRNERTSVERIANLSAFMGKLDDALVQQREVCAGARMQLEAARNEWQAARQREHSFEVLRERRADAARRIDSRRQQKAQDEHTMRRLFAATPGIAT